MNKKVKHETVHFISCSLKQWSHVDKRLNHEYYKQYYM